MHKKKQNPAITLASLTLSDLKTNYLTEPLGIETTSPITFSWKMKSNTIGQRQTSYQIVVKDSQTGNVMWDSGKQESGRSVAIEYGFNGQFELLQEETKYTWSVTVQASSGTERTSTSFFETGTTWDGAEWITIKNHTSDMRSLLFRTEQALSLNRNIESARLYITGLGAYEAFINGKPVRGEKDCVLAPGWSDYSSYIHYQTFDVTDYLTSNDKTVTLGAIVGSGWYGSSIVDASTIGYYTILGQPDVLERCLLAKLVISYSDGTSQKIVTNTTHWKASANSPYEQDGIYEGETYNALKAREVEGWNAADYDDSDWAEVSTLFYKGQIVASNSGLIYEYKTLPLKSAYSYNAPSDIAKSGGITSFGPDGDIPLKSGDTLIADFGQNAAATVVMELSAPAGTTINMQPGEAISDGRDKEYVKGTLIPGACKDRGFRYIASGDTVEIYKARFHFTGYRYLEITSDSDILIHNISSQAVSSIENESGFVNTSSDLLNQFIQNSKWSQASNFNSVPTDCPQREYYGWAGDVQIFAGAAMYHFDCARFFGNYIDIMNDYLKTYGHYGPIMPMHNNNFYSKMIGAGWSDAGIIVPWVHYSQTGDLTLVRRYWPEMTKYTDRINTDGYVFSHGDWNGGNERAGMRYLCCCYNIYINLCMSKMASGLGNEAESQSYAQAAADKRAETISHYITDDGDVLSASADDDGKQMLDSQKARCVDNAQTALAWAILLELYDTEKQRQAIVANLVKSVRNKNQTISTDRGENTLSTGFLGVHVLLPALSEGGRGDVAYDLMMNTDLYTFLYAVAHGATTTWEHWRIWTEDNGYVTNQDSHNHYSYGVASEWVYKYLLGIQKDESSSGFKHFILQPQVNAAITYANGSYMSYYGKIVSNWTADQGELKTYHCLVPANTSATLYLPVAEGVCVNPKDDLPPSISFEGIKKHKGLLTAAFALPSGAFNFTIADGRVSATITDGYISD